MRLLYFAGFLLTVALLASCGSYRHNIMFEVTPDQIQSEVAETESNYTIQKNDLLTLEVFTNQGEKLVDPNQESFKEGNVPTTENPPQYFVDINGYVKLPLVNEIKLEGLTIREAEAILQKAYGRFYEEAFVVLGFNNKRVIVLGAPGGQVIPLVNNNMQLTEVLALARGITADGRANNIRVIRGNQVFVADFSSFKGYQASNMAMHPGDVIYIEPVRKPFIEALRDYTPIITIVTSLATLIFIISQVK